VNWPIGRLLLSYFANVYARWVTGLPSPTPPAASSASAARCSRRIELDRVESNGYAFQIEMSFRAWKKGFRIGEIPIMFVDRDIGESKMSKKIVREAVWRVWRIMLRLQRIGFTPDARPADLEAAFSVLARTPAEIGAAGVTAAMAAAAPAGVYASTTAGDVYRPAPAPAPSELASSGDRQTEPEEASAEMPPEPPPDADSGAAEAPIRELVGMEEIERIELAEFELLDEPLSAAESPASAGAPPGTPAKPALPAREEPLDSDLFHFFRAAQESVEEDEVELLPRRLHECDNMNRFDVLAQSAGRAAVDLARTEQAGRAVDVLDALVTESQRPDRNRFFREAAAGALRAAAGPSTLPHLVRLMTTSPAHRDRVLRFLVFTGGDALASLRTQLVRTPDEALRASMLRALLSVDGEAERLVGAAMAEPGATRMLQLLELARGPEIDAETAVRWAARAAGHAEPAVRASAIALAAHTGGRAALRVLLDLLSDADPGVRTEAVQALGRTGETASAPFLARALAEGGDEEFQLATIAALGRIGSPDSVAPLLSVVHKRQLFGGRKSARLKMAAVQALGRIATPAAREALAAVAAGRDDLAAEARRVLTALD
jgi:hypothetical protein